VRRYALRDLVRNPRRTLSTLLGIALGVALFSAVLFFIDGSGASMTARAIAPVTIDVQAVLTEPLGRPVVLVQHMEPAGRLAGGATAHVSLVVRNTGAVAANEVVVRSLPNPGLEYVRGSAQRNGSRLADVGGKSPFAYGTARIGANLGSVPAHASVRITYTVRASLPVRAALVRSTISTRVSIVPQQANAPGLVSLTALRSRISHVPGVSLADPLAFASLAPRALSVGRRTVNAPAVVFGFDASYAEHSRQTIIVRSGALSPNGAVLSEEAARTLGVQHPGGRLRLVLPGTAAPVWVRVSGIADLSRARALFQSRQGASLEAFLYVPNSVVVGTRFFERVVLPAYRRAAAARSAAVLKSPPTLEVDVRLERSSLHADPSHAFEQTSVIRHQIEHVAVGQSTILDNIGNVLAVAETDASLARRMFLFLGLPGLLLAAFLAAYAGTILAAAQRRETANLRLRGASIRQLTQVLAFRTVALAGVGSVLGMVAGAGAALVVLGASSLFSASTWILAQSALEAALAGIVTTGLALYIPGRRALTRNVSGERRELAIARRPFWRRAYLDIAAAVVAAVAAVIAFRSGAFDTPIASVSNGVGVQLSASLVFLPLGVWAAGTLLSIRTAEALARRIPVARSSGFGPLVRGVLGRSLVRRPGALAAGVLGVSLVTAFGIGLAFFASTYDAAKRADARFTVGSDIRVTASPVSARGHELAFASRLHVAGVASVTPVVARLENAFLRSIANSDVKDLAAIDVRSFAATAPVSDAFFPGSTAAHSLSRLTARRDGILIDPESASVLKVGVGDRIDVVLARGTKYQVLRKMTIVGLFDRLPGFPEGLQAIVNLSYYVQATGSRRIDFFLARTQDSSDAGLAKAVAALRSGPGTANRLSIDTTHTTLNREQSSLTALNVRGLVDLDLFFSFLTSASVIAIFVFGLLLQRRREYVTLRAQGLPARTLQALVLGETAFAAFVGLAVGTVVGTGMGLLLVGVLKPLFILAPAVTVPVTRGTLLFALVAGATLAASAGALAILGRLSPAEVLREQ